MESSQHKLTKLFQSGRSFTYRKGDVIIRAGDTPSGVYYIVSGWVKVYSLCKDGEPNIIMTLRPGEVFPVAWALSGMVRDINFGALDTTETRRISRERFQQAMQADSDIMYSAVHLLAQDFFVLASELDNLQYRTAREKVVFRLIFLANRFGKPQGEGIRINIRVPSEYIARSTSITRETASRELSRLNRKRLAHTVNGEIIIPDLPRLCHEISQRFDLNTLSLN